MHDTYNLASKTVEDEVHVVDCPVYDLMRKKFDHDFFDHMGFARVSWSYVQQFLTMKIAKMSNFRP